MKKIDINEGYSLDYLIHSFFIIIIGILLFLVHYSLAIAVIIFGAVLLLAKAGVVINPDSKKALVYRSIFGYKFGNTIALDAFNHVRLKHNKEATKMQSRGPSHTIRTKTYTLLLVSENNKMSLHEFTDYKFARKVIDTLKTQLGYSTFDEVDENRKLIKRKIANSKRK